MGLAGAASGSALLQAASSDRRAITLERRLLSGPAKSTFADKKRAGIEIPAQVSM
jgi:hypothetical protein